VVVTGSAIPTADNVTIAPVETVTAADIERTGAQDVLSALKKLSVSFVGAGNISHTLNNGGFGEANVSVRNLPTLVLLDGRRMAGSAFSAIFNAGNSVDLNLIPISMVDRIEVVKDGASALYGSDAIGGVVNIITKKNWNGFEVNANYGFATQAGGYTEQKVALTGGTSTEATSFTAGVQYFRSDSIEAKDRYVASTSPVDLAAMGIAPIQGYFSPSYNGRVGNFILSGYTKFTGLSGPGAYLTPPVDTGVSYNTIQDYNAAHPGVYIPIASTPVGQVVGPILAASGNTPVAILNTTDFGSLSVQSQDRRIATANVEHQIFEDRARLFADFLYANTRSVGGLAPSPMFGLATENIFIPGNNPYNPFQRNIGLGVAGSPNVRSRFVDTGNRFFDSQTDYYRFTGGLKGDFENGYSYETAYNYNKTDQIQYTRNAVNGVALNQALTPDYGADPTGKTSKLLDANGNAVPTYNMFGVPGQNDPRTINLLHTTLFNGGSSEEWSYDGVVRGDLFEMKPGKVKFAVGGSYREESLSLFTDGLSQIGQVPGLNPALPFPGGKRTQSAAYIQVNIPITSPEWDIPGLYKLDLTASGRYEQLDPGGESAVPSVGFRWQPIDQQVTIHGTYSEGFIAPSLYNLYGPTRTSNPNISVQGVSQQEQTLLPSNPNLAPSGSENFTLGITYSPKQIENLTFSMDYYKIDQTGIPYNPDANSITADLNAKGSTSPYAGGFTFADGTKLTTGAPNQINVNNFGQLVIPTLPGSAAYTDGLDFRSDYILKTDTAGTFAFFALANLTMSYDVRLGPGQPKVSYLGLYTDPQVAAAYQGLLPDWQLRMGFDWYYGGFKYSVMAKYIPEVTDPGDTFANSGGSALNSYTSSGATWKIPSYYTVDMRLAYEFGKNSTTRNWYDKMTVAVGVNNIADAAPPFIPSSSEDNTDKTVYDIIGRFVYLEFAKKF